MKLMQFKVDFVFILGDILTNCHGRNPVAAL